MQSRPAVKVLGLFVLGIIAGRFFQLPLFVGFGLGALSVFAAFMLWYAEKGSPLLLQVSLALGLIAIGFLRYELTTGLFPADHISHFTQFSDQVVIRGVVTNYPERRLDKVRVTVASREIATPDGVYRVQGNCLLNDYDCRHPLHYGDEVIIRGKLRRPRDQRNPGEFDYREFLMAQGIHATVSVYDQAQLRTVSSGNGNWLLRNVIFPGKSYLDNFISNHLPQTEAALLRGLLIGERGEITPELRESFANLGVVHILAVSGLHVGFIILICIGVFGFLRVPYAGRVVLTIFALIFYAYLTNLKPPVVRASTMGGILLLGTVLERKTDVYNSLALAALLILIFNPLELFQPGFQLSFTAVTAIVYIYPKLRNSILFKPLYEKIKNRVVFRYPIELLLVSIAAFLGTLPFTVLYFHRIPMFAMLANLFVIPLAFLSLANGIAAAVFHSVIPFVGELYLTTAGFFLSIMIEIVEFGSSFRFVVMEVYRFSLWHALVYSFSLLFLLDIVIEANWRRSAIYGLVLANLFLWPSLFSERGGFTLTFLDVGQGDAVLLTFPHNRHLLVDAGPKGRFSDAGEWVVVPYLKRQGIDTLDAVVMSHPDADHLGGIPYLLRHVTVREVWDNGQAKATHLYQDYLYLIDSLRVKRRILKAGEVITDFAPAGIFVLHPSEDYLANGEHSANDGSLALKVSYGDIDVMLAGDVERSGETRISGFGDFGASEILKVNHHGSRTSSSPEFLKTAAPEWAVISVGEFNKFEHPHPEVLQRLDQAGVRLCRTDLDAAVILRTDGHKVERIFWK